MTLLNKSPEMCERLAAANPSEEMLTILLRRRSLTVKDMIGPGPSQDEIDLILTIGSRVPDHKKQVPWRFLTIEGDARHKAGEKLRSIFAKNNPDTDNDLLDFEQNLLTRAPLVIAVISTATPDNPKVPEWEQILTAGAVDGNGLRAGFSGQGPTSDGRIKPDLATMGAGPAVINSAGQVTTSNGTSFSSPILCGAMATVLQAVIANQSSYDIQSVMQSVKNVSSHASQPDTLMGWGIPNFHLVLLNILGCL